MSARHFDKIAKRDPSESWTPETARQAEFILAKARRRCLGKELGVGVENSTLFVCAELIDSGYLDGWVTLGADGRPRQVTEVRITTLGLEYMENFDDARPRPFVSEKTLWFAKGIAVTVLFACLLALVPESNIRAGKPNDFATNNFPIVKTNFSHTQISPVFEDANKMFGTSAAQRDGSRFFPILCVRCTQTE